MLPFVECLSICICVTARRVYLSMHQVLETECIWIPKIMENLKQFQLHCIIKAMEKSFRLSFNILHQLEIALHVCNLCH